MLKGIDPSRLATELGNMKMKASDAAELGGCLDAHCHALPACTHVPNHGLHLVSTGLVGADRARRGEGTKPPTGYIAPETAGLPVDDAYNYLALMKR